MRKIYLILIIFTLTLLNSINSVIKAQNVEFEKENFPNKKDQYKQAVRDIKEADKIIENEGTNLISQALPLYIKANDFNPNNALLNYKIGKCYLMTDEKVKSIPYLEKAAKLNKDVNPDLMYLLGKAYHYNMEWDKAISTYKEAMNKTSSANPAKIKEIQKKIEECNTGKELIKKPTRVFIDNIGPGVNTKYPEYSPCISADESMIIFTSRRDNENGTTLVSPEDNKPYEDIYISYNDNGKWTDAINPGKPLNSDTHDAAVALSPDGQKLFIYKGDNGGDIYQCDLKKDQWSKPDRLPKTINTEYHESSASFSFDGKTIYFVSDKPGGFGGRDIYMSKMNEKGKWGEAINLGPIINTPYDEESVFMHPDGKTLYFSSKGHNTMGGYDIFKSVFENGTWSDPENIGYPVNTPDDDVFLSVAANGKHAYYTSAKPGGYGDKDIYMITFLGPEKEVVTNTEDNLLASLTQPISETVVEKAVEIKTNQVTILKGKILDDITKQPVLGTIEITDNEKNQLVATFESNASTGKYLVSLPSGKNYGIAVKSENYLFHSENIDVKSEKSYQEIYKDIYLKKATVGTKIVLKNIFFDFDKSTLRNESTAELERLTKLLNDMPALRIEISGHTDNKGTATYNKKLSEDRAQAVVDYLVSKGINKSRLEYKGYGFDQPIAKNDTEQGRQMNRRTEFKILSK
ncbi:MAG: OmpA family protein [Bacteroidota bacterium]|nr:OmpA family protein [Bacteroidota bacterium]